jgi:short-subunit dehydrogenase
MTAPPRILILGAASAIAQAYARRRAAEGAAFTLAGRDGERLRAIGADLLARGASKADTVAADLADTAAIETALRSMRAYGDPNEVVVAYGVLGDQAGAENDLAAARRILDSNFTTAALWMLALLKDWPASAPLTIVGIGSVAGDRGRASNFLYGSAKGGFDRFCEGLAQKYAASPVRIILVKPGLVDTPMTAHIVPKGPLWAKPERIAGDIHRAVTSGRRVVYTPWFWRPIMTVIRHLPWFMFKRLKI